MEWEQKVKLVEALNAGNNKEACQIILNNDMDMQAWDMFVSGMDLKKYDDYRSLSDKIVSIKNDYIKYAGIVEVLRFGMLIYKLGLEGENEN
jgi:hypothetical protein